MKRKIKNRLTSSQIQSLIAGDYEVATNFIDWVDKDDRTPLFYFILSDNNSLLRNLVIAGADVNRSDKNGWTALHHSVQRFNKQAVDILLANGANIEAKDDYGNTPLWRAVFSSEGRGEIIRLLLDNKANPDSKNNSGISPLDLAADIANYDVMKFFKT